MDTISALLLGILNVPVFLGICRIIRRRAFGDKRDFWQTLLSWSFDPHAFFDREQRHNHLAVLLLTVSFACCVLLVFVEYGLTCRLMDLIRG